MRTMHCCACFVAIFVYLFCCVSTTMHSSENSGLGEELKTWFENANLSYSSADTLPKSSIICTIGPSSNTPNVIQELKAAGMRIARLNFSHGSIETHEKTIDMLRSTMSPEDKFPLAIAIDTKGPEIRTGMFQDQTQKIQIAEKSSVTITTDEAYMKSCTGEVIYVDYKNIATAVEKSRRIFIDDGLLELEVNEILSDKKNLRCTALNSHEISSKRGVNLPGAEVDLPAISDLDKKHLKFAVEQKLDMVFASFIRDAASVNEIRNYLISIDHLHGSKMKIIAKIENQQGVRNLLQIVKAADGIMVARGDLGIEIPFHMIPAVQRQIIEACRLFKKPVICATQMLESMISKPRPTHAEGNDVFGAILMGADCVMLSGETANGKYPTKAVAAMSRLIVSADDHLNPNSELHFCEKLYERFCTNNFSALLEDDFSVEKGKYRAIVIVDRNGVYARELASHRPPHLDIFFVTDDKLVAAQSLLTRKCFPLLISLEATSWECCEISDFVTISKKELAKFPHLASEEIKSLPLFYKKNSSSQQFDGVTFIDLEQKC